MHPDTLRVDNRDDYFSQQDDGRRMHTENAVAAAGGYMSPQ